MVKVTVIATGVQRETPPYLFEPKGSENLWERPAWEKKWEPYETPSFIRRNKATPLRKTPDEIS